MINRLLGFVLVAWAAGTCAGDGAPVAAPTVPIAETPVTPVSSEAVALLSPTETAEGTEPASLPSSVPSCYAAPTM